MYYKNAPIVIGGHQSGTQVFFCQGRQDEADHKRRNGNPDAVENKTKQAEGDHHPDIEHAVGKGVRTENTKRQHNGN